MIAIHERAGSFSDRWIDLCRSTGANFLTVNMFSSSIVADLRKNDVSVLLSHPPMASRTGSIAAKNLIQSLAGSLCTFPTVADFWHFDDKIAQMYIFQAFGIPTPDTYVFYDRESADEWLASASLPAVFKLRSGAGSINVSMVKTASQGAHLINRMFGRGYSSSDSALKDISTKLRLHRARRDWLAVAQRAPGTLTTWWRMRQQLHRERGYVYFQEFIPENMDDTRVTIIGERAFAFRRAVRPGDFRASGSGSIDYDPDGIDTSCVRTAFDAARRLGSTCMAFDFVKRPSDAKQLVVEMSFGFKAEPVAACPGHWLPDMKWNPGPMRPEDAIYYDSIERAGRCET